MLYNINAYDMETYLKKNYHIPYCICYIYNNKIKSFYYKEGINLIEESLYSIFEEKLKTSRKNIFYIHNLNFDGVLLLDYLTNSAFEYSAFIREMRIYRIEIFYKKKKIEFRCSYKLIPTSLKKIAESFDIEEKLPFPYLFVNEQTVYYRGNIPPSSYFNSENEYQNFLKKYTSCIFDLKTYSILYCTRDIVITSQFVQKLCEILDVFKISLENVYSAPSLSFKIFEKIFNKNKIKFRYNFTTHKYIKNAYYGGRCEVYGNPVEGEHLFHFDFSGMYGQCMMEKFAFGKYEFKNNFLSIDKPGFYCIEFESNMEIPVLPHHSIENKKLMFANGIQKGFYWYEEIKLFLEMGGKILKIHHGVVFSEYDYVFNEFIDFFTDIKKKGSSYKIFGKLMINSLYGRFGMDYIDKYSFFVKKSDLVYYEKNYKILTVKEINDVALIEIELNQYAIKKLNLAVGRTKSNVAIAAAITSKGRIKLYRAQQSVLSSNGRILYSDTDSVFAAFNSNVIGMRHGDIFWDPSDSSTVIKDAVFVNPKTYGILYPDNTQIVKIKGLNQNIDFYKLKEKFYKKEDLIIDDFVYLNRENFQLKNIKIQKVFNLSSYEKRYFIDHDKNTKSFNVECGHYFKRKEEEEGKKKC